MAEHIAKRWVEEHFPSTRGPLKAMLILAFGAGVDAGMTDAQDLLMSAMRVIRDETDWDAPRPA